MAEDEEPEDTQGVYGDGGREDLIGNDEISAEEDAFMSGYNTEEEKKEVVEDIYEKAFDATVSAKGKKGKATKPAKKAAAKKTKKANKPAHSKKAKPAGKAKSKKAVKKSSKKVVKKAKKPSQSKKAKQKPSKKKSNKPRR